MGGQTVNLSEDDLVKKVTISLEFLCTVDFHVIYQINSSTQKKQKSISGHKNMSIQCAAAKRDDMQANCIKSILFALSSIRL